MSNEDADHGNESSMNDTENENKRPQKAKRRPTAERKVWAECYPGGDVMVELGHMDTDDLYLQSGEANALREVLNKLLLDSKISQGTCSECGGEVELLCNFGDDPTDSTITADCQNCDHSARLSWDGEPL